MSGKQEEIQTKEQNKKKQITRKFEEITNQEKWKRNCLDKLRGCAIGFLPAQTIVSETLYKLMIAF